MSFLTKLFNNAKAPLLAIFVSFLICAIFLKVLGESPHVLFEAFYNTLFTPFGLGYTLFYATPLIFVGLSVAFCYHAGLFNIGAEGQLYIGSLGVVTSLSLVSNFPFYLGILFILFSCILFSGLWGGIAGVLKAKRGSHEVIVTVLLNFIAIAIVDYCILYVFKNPLGQNPETFVIPEKYFLPGLSSVFDKTPVNVSFIGAVALCFFFYFYIYYTTRGYQLRAVGQNIKASQYAGIAVDKTIILATCVSGALAGLVGINEVLGHQHKLVQGFSPQYGFTGIAVALLARNHPIGILFSAFLFGALHNSSREIEFLSETVTKEISLVLEAILIAVIASPAIFNFLKKLRKKKNV
jgi:simple sugar transport system permease protein